MKCDCGDEKCDCGEEKTYCDHGIDIEKLCGDCLTEWDLS